MKILELLFFVVLSILFPIVVPLFIIVVVIKVMIDAFYSDIGD